MLEYNSITSRSRSDFVNMGHIHLRQPLPNAQLQDFDPFVLLHHYGPYEVNEENNPFDLGPHPHRGFEPITFLIQGEQLHRDSLGNESVVKAGDVQWTTAGRGVIHAEAPTKEFVKKGGVLEGIQLWLNLPGKYKMIPANYQHVKREEIPVVTTIDRKVSVKVVAGSFENTQGKIKTQTTVNALLMDMKEEGEHFVNVPKKHQALVYLLHGKVEVNNTQLLETDVIQMLTFANDGDGFGLKAHSKSKLLVLSGEPIKEHIVSWGPYVMNTQTEIMEALRDYKMGKMGYLTR